MSDADDPFRREVETYKKTDWDAVIQAHVQASPNGIRIRQ